MSDDTSPAAAEASKAPSLSDGHADRPVDDGLPSAEEQKRLPNVGNAHAPTAVEEIEDRPDKTLYERLADKDVTPTA